MDYPFLQDWERGERLMLRGAIEEYLRLDKLQDYKPYPKQAEFHALGRHKRNRMLRAGNQNGKTYSAGAEFAMHVTGEYPDWWRGHRFRGPIVAWACGETADATRDNVQRILLGNLGQIGTGMIPKRCLSPIFGMAKGISKAYDFQLVKHASGGLSLVKFRNYTQLRTTWQGVSVDLVWFDEEPPLDMYEEGLARTIATQGHTMMTFTPLKGRSEVVKMYMGEQDPLSDRVEVVMTIYDALHIPRERIDAEIARWPKHQREARVYGKPLLGSGQIYPFDEDDLTVDPFPIPDYWPQIGGLDIGGTGDDAHPTGAVRLAHDRDNDVVYVIAEHRKQGATPQVISLTLRRWGSNLLWAWPHDGLDHEKGTGVQIAKRYREYGLNLMPFHSQYPDRKDSGGMGSHSRVSRMSVERGITDIYERMESDRLKVFSTCTKWFEEQRLYHRKDGQVVKKDDDLMDATRMAIMSLPAAQLVDRPKRKRRRDVDWQAV